MNQGLKYHIKSLTTRPANQIGPLDGLRSIAILLVFFVHAATLYVGNGGTHNFISSFPLVRGGWIGVDLFFVLSGFLIGGQLWKEFAKSGSISFLNFSIKRSFRIWPLYFFLAAFFMIARGPLKEGAFPFDLVFISNYLGQTVIKGTWSLSIEEQFYIFAPLFFVVMSFFRPKLKTMRWVLIIIFLMAPLVRHFNWQFIATSYGDSITNEIQYIYFPFHTHFDGLIMGLILSNFWNDTKIKTKRVLFGLLVFSIISIFLRSFYRVEFNYMTFAGIFGFAVWYCLNYQSLFTKILSFKFFHYISKLSFGIYLLHYQFLIWMAPIFMKYTEGTPSALRYLLFVGFSLALTSLVAAITYVTIESPFLSMRNRCLTFLKARKAPVSLSLEFEIDA